MLRAAEGFEGGEVKAAHSARNAQEWPYLFLVGASVAMLGLIFSTLPPWWAGGILIIMHFLFVAIISEAARHAEGD